MRMCFNKNVIVGLAVVALGVLLFAPNLLGAAVPLLVVAACPLSMIVMMRAMTRQSTGSCATDRQSGGERTRSTSEVEQAAQLRELQEEVNRLRAEMRLRSNEPHA